MMLGKIVNIDENLAHIKIDASEVVNSNIINMHVLFEDEGKIILGEIETISEDILKVRFLGEVINKRFIPGVIRKPSLVAKLRLLKSEELRMIIGDENQRSLILGTSPLYDQQNVHVDINELFSNHMAVFGNSGSGKSYGVARLLQNVFLNKKVIPYKSNFFIFDAYGEYHNAFSKLKDINPNFNFKIYSTSNSIQNGFKLQLPIWLMGVDELALLLSAEEHSQLIILERILKLVRIFAEDSEISTNFKNHLIAKAIMTILYTNQTAAAKRNDIFSILASCSTAAFNLDALVTGIGYKRKFRDCFVVDTSGDFTERVLVTEYISSYINDEYEKHNPRKDLFYTIQDLEKALEFALISEGLLRNDKSYHEAISLKVRLHSIITSDNVRFFDVKEYISRERFVSSLVALNGKKAQIVNFNLEDIEDWFAKFIVKFYSKIFFDFTKTLKTRAAIPINIFLEEAHRYVQNDKDNYLLGYNIFDRIAKEGRKYGLIFNLISQRPVEISETVISQCSNFMIFKMNHPKDLEYIKQMLPNISSEIVEKQKSLQPGTCVAFGRAFKVAMMIKMQLPNPEPHSSNADVVERWTINK